MANNNQLQFRDCSFNPATGLSVEFTPLYPPAISNNFLSTADPVIIQTDGSGQITSSLIPDNYCVKASSQASATSFFYTVGNTSGSIISASHPVGVAPLVTFNFIGSDSSSFANHLVTLSPVDSYPKVFSGSVILHAATQSYTNSTGSAVFRLVPQVYQVDVSGVTANMTFYISASGVSGSWNAKDILVLNPSSGIKVKFDGTRYYPIDNANYAISSSYAQTAGFASVASKASLADNFKVSNRLTLAEPTGEADTIDLYNDGSGNLIITTGDYIYIQSPTTFTEGATGNLTGTASWANNSVTASLSTTSSYALNAKTASFALNAGGSTGTTLVTGSTYPITASWAKNSKTASIANTALSLSDGVTLSNGFINGVLTFNTVFTPLATIQESDGNILFSGGNDDWAFDNTLNTNNIVFAGTLNSVTPSQLNVLTASILPVTASRSLTTVSSSYAQTASFALNAGGGTTLVSGSTYPITASWANNARTASFALNAGTTLTTASTYQVTSSWANNSKTASLASNVINGITLSNPLITGSSVLTFFGAGNTNISMSNDQLGNLQLSTGVTFDSNGDILGHSFIAGDYGFDGASATFPPVNIVYSNEDYTNTSGANSHLLMSNPDPSGQNVVSHMIGGVVQGKWRIDSQGNINWVAYAGSHFFFQGGDYGVGTQMFDTNAETLNMHILINHDSGLTDGVPSDTSTPAAWIKTMIDGDVFYVPAYQ